MAVPNHADVLTESRLTSLELTAPTMGFWALLWTDYEVTLVDHSEPRWQSKLLFAPRLLVNPSLQLALLVRLAQRGPRLLLHVVRLLQLVLFSSEMYKFHGDDGIELGPAIAFPHPANIFVGTVEIGSGVTLYNNTTIGANRHIPRGQTARNTPRIGDRAVIYGYTSIQGPYDIGHDAVVGTHVVLDEHVPPGALKTIRRLRLREDWPGEDRGHWRAKLP